MDANGRHAIGTRLDKAAAACARRGAQLTELRRRVLGLILEADGPVTAYQLLDRLKEARKGAVPPTIYRALYFLMEQRLIHKVERLNAFIPCIEAGHRHPVQFLICRRCGTVAEIEDRAAARALEHAAERAGFHPHHAIVEIEGTCAACLHPSRIGPPPETGP
ncbi:MAG TPA: Fur family transcriptional regulator [Stellaceae bacterium]|nr:Fur family transcriptional regulator [Stellaceae bacterium]